jgi:hypothetical protein
MPQNRQEPTFRTFRVAKLMQLLLSGQKGLLCEIFRIGD